MSLALTSLAGLDASAVKESNGVISTVVDGCEIRVRYGRIEQCEPSNTMAVVLPCNEYFDDECAFDARSALGAYVNKVFPGQVMAFMTLVRDERKNRLGPGGRTPEDGKRTVIKLWRWASAPLEDSSRFESANRLIAKSSFISEGISELMTRLADERLYEVVMPVLGAGHGGMDSTVAFVTLVLALAEAVRYFPGGGRPLRKATIIVFRKDSASSPEIDPIVIRRTLAITGASSLRREVAGPR